MVSITTVVQWVHLCCVMGVALVMHVGARVWVHWFSGRRRREGAEDAENLTTERLLRQSGAASQQHVCITADGWWLVIHRSPRPGGPPVLLLHALLQSSEAMAADGGSGSLAAVLWRAGFDVWIGNARANRYSATHSRLRRADRAYWDFSIDDIAVIDVPAMVQHVRGVTGRRVHIVGFSHGSAAAMAALAVNWRMAADVRSLVALAPPTNVVGA